MASDIDFGLSYNADGAVGRMRTRLSVAEIDGFFCSKELPPLDKSSVTSKSQNTLLKINPQHASATSCALCRASVQSQQPYSSLPARGRYTGTKEGGKPRRSLPLQSRIQHVEREIFHQWRAQTITRCILHASSGRHAFQPRSSGKMLPAPSRRKTGKGRIVAIMRKLPEIAKVLVKADRFWVIKSPCA